jgi:protein transport protein SEC24
MFNLFFSFLFFFTFLSLPLSLFNFRTSPPRTGPPAQMLTRTNSGGPERLNSPQRLARSNGRSNSSPRIDPQQIPGPQGATAVEGESVVRAFATRERVGGAPPVLPPSTSSYVVSDQGNASPRFMRMTVNCAPASKELVQQSKLPFGVLMQPLADVGPGEEPVPVVNFGEDGPLRCQRCRAYISPFARFVEGGQRYVCAFCTCPNDVPAYYFCNTDGNGVRRDVLERPELCKGSVDFLASKAYIGRPVTEPVFIFVIDVSTEAVASGVLGQVCMTIRASLDDLALEDRTRVGFITFDSTVHFYRVRSGARFPVEQLVVPDVEEPFVPLPSSFLVKVTEHLNAIDAFLAALPKAHLQTTETRSALGAALTFAHRVVADSGGRIMCFQASLPNHGPGLLQRRDNPSAYGTDKERALLAPQVPFYEKLGADCARSNVSVDMFLFPRGYIDVATLSSLPRATNGTIFMYPGFRSDLHGTKLHSELAGTLSAVHAYDGLLRVRVSGALTVDKYLGNIHMLNATDVSLPALDARTTVAAIIGHNEKQDESRESVIQCALLYTNAQGQRMIRVHNLSVPTTSSMANIFRSADLDALLVLAARVASNAVLEKPQVPLATIRDAFVAQSIDALTVYRKHCATATSPGQLILPEALKLLPLYALALQKQPGLSVGAGVSVDRRIFQAFLLGTLSVPAIVRLVHPRMYCLSTLPDWAGQRNSIGEAILPPQESLGADKLNPSQVYLLEDGQVMILWVGRMVSSSFLTDLFGVVSSEELTNPHAPLPVTPSPINAKVRSIVETLASRNQYYPLLTTVRQGDSLDAWFNGFLIEDNQGVTKSYVDFLCHLHKMIQTNLST